MSESSSLRVWGTREVASLVVGDEEALQNVSKGINKGSFCDVG